MAMIVASAVVTVAVIPTTITIIAPVLNLLGVRHDGRLHRAHGSRTCGANGGGKDEGTHCTSYQCFCSRFHGGILS
jgi:hypothetical protein